MGNIFNLGMDMSHEELFFDYIKTSNENMFDAQQEIAYKFDKLMRIATSEYYAEIERRRSDCASSTRP